MSYKQFAKLARIKPAKVSCQRLHTEMFKVFCVCFLLHIGREGECWLMACFLSVAYVCTVHRRS